MCVLVRVCAHAAIVCLSENVCEVLPLIPSSHFGYWLGYLSPPAFEALLGGSYSKVKFWISKAILNFGICLQHLNTKPGLLKF